jgi:thymidylate synthase ThyX
MIAAEVVADSVSPDGKRLTSVSIVAHRFVLAEINTHRMLSRSYRSSRAVPVAKLLAEVRTNPAMPVYWGANEKGMQASGELDDASTVPGWTLTARGVAEKQWRGAAYEAARAAELLAATGLHKQIANRVLEPFLAVSGIITATEWDNFFGLRLHSAAQPEFRVLAEAIWRAMKSSTPAILEPGLWHTPYVDLTDEHDRAQIAKACRRDPKDGTCDLDDSIAAALKMSVARCARNSYASFDTGRRSTLEEDLATYAKLNVPGTESYDPTSPIHASPAEHQATPDEKAIHADFASGWRSKWKNPQEHGNFVGWRQYRKTLPGEAVAPLPKGYER